MNAHLMLAIPVFLINLFSFCQGEDSSQWTKTLQTERRQKMEMKSLPDSFLLTRKTALSFYKKHSFRHRRDLWEECYGEGCSFEEVDEGLGGEDLYQYYYSYRCKQVYGEDWTYSGDRNQQCSNSIYNVKVCATGYTGMGIGSRRWCSMGSYKAVWGFYMEAGCNDGEQASFKVMFNDPSATVRTVYNLGCRERATFSTVYGASSMTIEMIGGGGGDRYVSTSSFGWYGWQLNYCGNPGSPYNGYKSGTNYIQHGVVSFGCNNGYTLVGSSSITCLSGGWSAAKPVCKRQCRPGTYSSRGYEPCYTCPIGTYQPHWSYTYCYSCPTGKTTTGTGKTHSSQCHHKCSYVECQVSSWSCWKDTNTPQEGHCASQERTRSYNEVWHDVIREQGCDGLQQTCPQPQKQYREKLITCPPLPGMKYGSYSPISECTSKHMICGSTCTVACNPGFRRQGQSSDAIRVCQSNGQWSNLKTYCKDITPPSLTCPDSIEVGNDPGKSWARVNIPDPKVISDNTGIVPELQISPSDLTKVHVFNINDEPHTVKYTAKDQAGLTAECEFTVRVKDVEAPEVIFCPKSFRWRTSKSPDRVIWDLPVFKDNYNLELAINSLGKQPGVQMYWGEHHIKYTATDKTKHTATCEFKIDVGPMKCTVYDAPVNGARSCTLKVMNITQEFACLVQCNEEYTFPETAFTGFHCKSNGIWHAQVGFQQIPLPEGQRPWTDCSKKSNPSEVSTHVTVYAGSCNPRNEATSQQIKENFIKYISKNYFLQWSICIRSKMRECKLENVKVSCGKTTRRRRRRGITTENEYKISFDFDLNDLQPSKDNSIEKERLTAMMNEMKQFFSQINGDVGFAASSVLKSTSEENSIEDADILVEETPVKPKCFEGKVLKQTGDAFECVNCPVGTYYKSDIMKCLQCENGTFQDQEGQTYCWPCPPGTWTLGYQTKNFTECKRICGPGEFSSTGVETCLSCPVGTFQSSNRSTECNACPEGTFTSGTRTTSLEDCKKQCGPGEFSHNGLAVCLPCPKGQYQSLCRSTKCQLCPEGTTTGAKGAKSQLECL